MRSRIRGTGRWIGSIVLVPAVAGLLLVLSCEGPGAGDKGDPKDTSGPGSLPPFKVSIEEVPLEPYRRAAQLMEEVSGTSMASTWSEVSVHDEVVVMHRLDTEGVAYYEFTVVGRSAEDPLGSILVATGDHDHPVPRWSFAGEPVSQKLVEMAAEAGEKIDRIYMLDSDVFVGENSDGDRVASLGDVMRVVGLSQEALDVSEDQVELIEHVSTPVEVDGAIVQEFERKGPADLPIEFTAWSSWADLKAGYAEAYGYVLARHRQEVKEVWDFERQLEEFGLGLVSHKQHFLPLLYDDARYEVGAGSRGVMLDRIERANMPDVLVIEIGELAEDGDQFEITIEYPDLGQSETVRFFVIVEEGDHRIKSLGWSDWDVHWADGDPHVSDRESAAHNAQRPYGQRTRPDGKCLSGCGPVAWAMLFGWADYMASENQDPWTPHWGVYRKDGGYGEDAVAPETVDTGVRNMSYEIMNDVGTFCVQNMGATFHHRMSDARNYLQNRAPLSLKTAYNALYIQTDRQRNLARAEIVDKKMPVIVGTGALFSMHYEVAYGYRERSRRGFLGTTQWTREFFVNRGWDGLENDWFPAASRFTGTISAVAIPSQPCTPECTGKECGDDGCGGGCGTCQAGDSCVNGSCTCVAACTGKECGEDGCGGVCGTCPVGEACLGGTCTPCSPDCAGKQCGDDGCGGTCGACGAGEACVQYTCTPCSPSCSGKECGPDDCGDSCGTCGAGHDCVSGSCVCVPNCVAKQCGADGCGGSCGTCNAGLDCVSGKCVCPPNCAGKQCGPDGCGGSCGTCNSGDDCVNGACQCSPDCSGKACGPDGCGGSCGTCPGASCGSWSSCSVPCGTGSRSRTCTSYACQSGTCSPASTTDSESCTASCPSGHLCIADSWCCDPNVQSCPI